MRDLFGNGGNWLAAGLAAAVVLPVLAVGFAVPLVLAAPIALVVLVGLAFLLAPRQLFEGLNVQSLGRGRLELARKVLTEAAPHRDRLRQVAVRLGEREIGGQLRHMADTADHILTEVEEDPSSLGLVTRFLTYYLPRAAEVAEGYELVRAKRQPDAQRLGEMKAMIGKLDGAFTTFADGLVDADLKVLDVELKLLEASLKEDLGTRP